MCGRIVQARSVADYFAALGWAAPSAIELEKPGFNIPPGTRPAVLQLTENGDHRMEPIWWGYKRKDSDPKAYSNARLDTILKGGYFWKALLKNRVIVPSDGWYEWTGEKGHKEPWFIHATDGKALLMAGISAWRPGDERDVTHGMAIVTDDAAGGMVDIHDRRPICLTPEDAREWLDPATPVERALEILGHARPETAFVWHRVDPKMNSSRYQSPDSIEPI